MIPPKEKKALLSSLIVAEGMIRNDVGRETVVVFDREGKGFLVKRSQGMSVDIEKEIRNHPDRFEGATLTHNHPNSAAFSGRDALTAGLAKLREIRAVSRLYRYSLSRPVGNLDLAFVENVVLPTFQRLFAPLMEELSQRQSTLSEAEYNQLFTHLMWERIASETDLLYTREAIAPK